MRYGFDYLTSGGWSGNWNELQFVEDTTVTLTTLEGEYSNIAFVSGAKLVGNFIGIVIISGSVIAYRRGTVGATNADLLLDLYPATAAYSLRKLKNTYSGSAIRVRRASDNAEQDIGFIGLDLDTASLTSFCTGTDGFVVTWYDQAGSFNATQATAANQPKIYDSSTGVILENGKAAIDFDGTDDFLVNSTINISQPITRYILGKSEKISELGSTFVDSNTTNRNLIFHALSTNSFKATYDNLGASLDIAYNNNRNLFYELQNNGSNEFAINGNSAITGDNGLNGLNQLKIGDIRSAVTTGNYHLDGNIQEIIIYASDQSANRTAIEASINNYYSIY